MRTFDPAFGLLGSDHPQWMVNREVLTFLSQECPALYNTLTQNEVNPKHVPSLARLFAAKRGGICAGSPAITVAAPLGVGLIPTYSTGRGVVMALAVRADLQIRDGTPSDDVADISSPAVACAMALLGHSRTQPHNLNCRFRPPLPIGAGLKTSSALGVTITAACGAAVGPVLDPISTARIALNVAQPKGEDRL